MKLIKSSEQRPLDGQVILYYFAPFDTWYQGTYRDDPECPDGFVSGRKGFTTFLPECPFWTTPPPLPSDYVNDW